MTHDLILALAALGVLGQVLAALMGLAVGFRLDGAPSPLTGVPLSLVR